MFDNGAHGDGIAGDGEYGATIDAQCRRHNRRVLRRSPRRQQSPAPGRHQAGEPPALEQVVNAAYRVDNTYAAAATNPGRQGAKPIFVIVMTAAEYTRFKDSGQQ